MSRARYNSSVRTRLDIGRRGFAPQIADTVRDARLLVGWSQRELAVRAGTSHTTVWRIEAGRADSLDLLALERTLAALGIRARLDLEARHLADRRAQADGVHARLNGFSGHRLEHWGWTPASEVQVGQPSPRGWIDTLAYREADRWLLVEEVKTEIVDVGAIQRSLAFYEREAIPAARGRGWRPRGVAVLLAVLDTRAVADRIADSRDLLRLAFPTPVTATLAWLRDPALPPPRSWTLAACDPASRSRDWLRPCALESRRRPTYADYRDAAHRLLRPRCSPGGACG